MATQVILLLIVLASTVVGTLLNAKPWVKSCIIALACASAALSVLQAYNDYQDSEFIKGALAAELASSKPTPAFQRAFSASLNRVAHRKGLWIQESVQKDQGVLYIFATQKTDIRAGALNFGLDSLGQSYARYVSKKSMDDVLSDAMYTVPDLKNSDAKANVMEELGLVGEVAIDDNVPWATENTELTVSYNYDPDEVEVDAANGPNKLVLKLNDHLIDSIIGLPPYARDWQAYEEFERQCHK